MTVKDAGKTPVVRNISVTVFLEGGYSHELSLAEDSPDLANLFQVLVARGSESAQPAEQFFQLPLDKGQAACSFSSRQLVSITTKPPVVVQIEQQPVQPAQAQESQAEPIVVRTPRHLIIDDFLGVDEHRDMLAYALANEEQFEAGTVTSNDANYRQNLVIMNFHEAAHSTLICNRLLTWFPQLTQMLGMELFPLDLVESQLTASNDGHYFREHTDGGGPETEQRTLSCVYYFFREPKAFSGGAFRLYDTWRQGHLVRRAETYQEIQPVSNRLVVFASESHHELMRTRCPSHKFEDSRFAITNWIRRAKEPMPDARFGWGHMNFGRVPARFGAGRGSTS
jgi:Rps23 Pro-64 3,4-dihydroxylase Tpa1-like proline 4-hydroxylase